MTTTAAFSRQLTAQPTRFPYPERLTYLVEWRFMDAGVATVDLVRSSGATGWNINLHIESAGLVSRLYPVADEYRVTATDRFCLSSAEEEGQEGKKRFTSRLTLDESLRRLTFDFHDLVKDVRERKELTVDSECTHEIAGALAVMRTLNLAPGQSRVVPVTDGKKLAKVRVSAESRDKISVAGNTYQTTRYEAFLFDNVLYRRKGRLLLWITDGEEHFPVQLRFSFGFPVGTVTVSLQKKEQLQGLRAAREF